MAVNDIIMGASGGSPSGTPLYIDDLFSTNIYNGNSSTQSVNNGIDIAGQGGLVIIKRQDNNNYSIVFDTARGAGQAKWVSTGSNAAENATANSDYISAFNSNGFTVTDGSGTTTANTTGATYAAWTFRKQAKFFDIVTYTGTGSARTISHNLGSVPGFIIVKRLDASGAWRAYHSGLTSASYYLTIDTTAIQTLNTAMWNGTAPTSTVFSVGTDTTVNASGGTYVAYLFASNASGFGTDNSQNAIVCGSYTGNGSATGPSINLGFEPQWVMIKNISATSSWNIMDSIRGLAVNRSASLTLDGIVGDGASTPGITATPTGFNILTTNAAYNTNGSTYVYVAIRKPMKTATSGTSVFNATLRTGTGATGTSTAHGKPVDLLIIKNRGSATSWIWVDRMRGPQYTLASDSLNVESNPSTAVTSLTSNVGFSFGAAASINSSGANFVDYTFSRSPGFFDIVTYTGTGANNTITHNLGVAPEFMIIKDRTTTGGNNWVAYHSAVGATKFLQVNGTIAPTTLSTVFNNTAPTSSVFSIGTDTKVNNSGSGFVAYLFASLAGISKVGSYTGNGSTQTIDCGFASGARFVLIKRYNVSGNWVLFDAARGVVTGNDPYMYPNSTAAEITNEDAIDPASSGFIVNTTTAGVNVNGDTYIYLAIA